MTARLRKIFGAKTDWDAKVREYEQRLEAGEQKLGELQADRLEHALPAAEGDSSARTELNRLAAEVAGVERDQGTIREALDQARVLLSQQRQREAAEAEQKRQAAFQRVAGELLEIDRRADDLMADLATTLDQRRAKLKGLRPLGKPDAVNAVLSRDYPERVAKRVLRSHVEVASVVRSELTLAELDAKTLGLTADAPRGDRHVAMGGIQLPDSSKEALQ